MSDAGHNMFAEKQNAIIRNRKSAFEENKRFNSEIISNNKTNSPFSPATTPQQVGQSANTKSAMAITNASVKSTQQKRSSKSSIGKSQADKANARREQETPAITQANLQQPSLFNLGF